MSRRFVLSFKPYGHGLAKLLGELEARVMDILWTETEGTARLVFEKVREEGRRLSYSTIKTIMERLVDKGLLERELRKNAYLYRPRLSREQFTQSAVNDIIDSLLATFADPVVSRFVERMGDADPAQMARLARLIEEATGPTETGPPESG